MLQYNDLILAFQELNLAEKTVVAHASLRSLGQVAGGADAVVTALLYNCGALIMPTHTYKPMIFPTSGPANNGVNYSRSQSWNRLAEPFEPGMPADVMMGVIPENLRQRPQAKRSTHPLLSFAGVNASKILQSQTIEDPLAPLMQLANADGWVLLLGVDHTTNTTIHLGEKLAGRKQFTRWALTPEGTTTCPGFPGCSAGFEQIEPLMRRHTITSQIGNAAVRAMPARSLVITVMETIKKNPQALLCNRSDCERCPAVRDSLK